MKEDLSSEKQQYIENHLATTKEYFEIAEQYLGYVKKQFKILEKINKKSSNFNK